MKQPAGSGPSMSLAKLGTSKRALSESNPKAKKKGLKGGKAAKGSNLQLSIEAVDAAGNVTRSPVKNVRVH